MKIAVNDAACSGCRVCELACSFHHAQVFSPEISSIKVKKNMRMGEIEWSIDSSCDHCEGETRPLCMEYCLYGAIREVE